MELDFTPDQDELRDGVRTVLAAECPITLVREIVEARVAGKDPGSDRLWAQASALGWPALTVPEPAGGMGLGAVELAVVVEELGQVLAPGVLLPTISQYVPAVRELGTASQQETLLGPVAHGEVSGTLAAAEASGSIDPATTTTIATPRDNGGFELRGEKHFVMGADAVDEVVVVARVAGTTGDDGVAAFAVPRADVTVDLMRSVDPSRALGTVTLDGVSVEASRVLGTPGPDVAAKLRRAIDEATVALALETVGTCQKTFDITLEYAKHREQFGVPIGSFQAIKHKFADMLLLLERARALGYLAAAAIAEDDDRRALGAAMVKAAAGDASERIAKEGIQVHGGIGYTWEHDMHLYVRRMRANAVLFGTAHEHRARVADLLGV